MDGLKNVLKFSFLKLSNNLREIFFIIVLKTSENPY